MEHYKISKLLNNSTVFKFVKKKWIEVNDLLSSQYSVNKNIRFKTSMLRSNLCDYSDATNLLDAAANGMIKLKNKLPLKIMIQLDHVFQKLTVR